MIGIYQILNLANNKRYIGQTRYLEKRFNQHLDLLKRCKHYNIYLQRAYNKYGIKSFEYSILEECLEDKLTLRENFWINYFGGLTSNNLYNLSGGEDAYYFPQEVRIKISIGNKGKHSRELNGMYGKHHTIESKIKMKDSINNKGELNGMYGKHHNINTRQKISKALKGNKLSEETRKRMSLSAKNRAQNPDSLKILLNNLAKKVKYDKLFVTEIQEKYKEIGSIRRLSKLYNLPYETTRQLVNRNVEDFYKKYN